MPIYLKLGDIKGDVQDARYKEWIQIESVNLNPNSASYARTGGTGKTDGSQTAIKGPVTLTMLSGAVSVKLVQLAGQGKVIPEVVIVLDQGETGSLTITMKDVYVSSYQFGAAGKGGSLPMDSFTLEPASIAYDYGPAPGEGRKTGPAVKLKNVPGGGAKWRR